MSQKVIITVAPTGSIPDRKDNPNIPYTAREVAAETVRAYEAGASVVHLHARDPQTGKPSSDIEVFRSYLDEIRAACPIVTQITTGGGATTLGLSVEDRLRPVLELLPDSASLNAGSMNFGRVLFPNTPDTIELYARRMKEAGVMPEFEAYDLSMINNVEYWVRRQGLLDPPYQFSFVMGVIGGIPATPKNLLAMREALDPTYRWQAIGIGRHQFTMGAMGALLGGGLRVGFEDNVYLSKGVLAKSNAELVEKAVRIVRELGLEVATLEEAREMLPLLNRG
ncbi:MAG: 3-keto-5-aminohexanoate cleavage protein [Proteobacteria bacterium]|nr:3-keto-5-aminohexanoate cleavage protein [Pseudomonadota bacterium]MBU1451463.1 3-keto-5-aminohexanoate cleavage protein [Pseudomonadota bacterium]MBU2468371.1 3-keto-5-aminohexanoate cleavage protein [Pseudomonadota bacterium]